MHPSVGPIVRNGKHHRTEWLAVALGFPQPSRPRTPLTTCHRPNSVRRFSGRPGRERLQNISQLIRQWLRRVRAPPPAFASRLRRIADRNRPSCQDGRAEPAPPRRSRREYQLRASRHRCFEWCGNLRYRRHWIDRGSSPPFASEWHGVLPTHPSAEVERNPRPW